MGHLNLNKIHDLRGTGGLTAGSRRRPTDWQVHAALHCGAFHVCLRVLLTGLIARWSARY